MAGVWTSPFVMCLIRASDYPLNGLVVSSHVVHGVVCPNAEIAIALISDECLFAIPALACPAGTHLYIHLDPDCSFYVVLYLN